MAHIIHILRQTGKGLKGLTKASLNIEPVTEETRQMRRKICAACPAATRTKSIGLYPINTLTPTSLCSDCRCNLYAKTKLAKQSCPRDKWQAAEPDPAVDDTPHPGDSSAKNT